MPSSHVPADFQPAARQPPKSPNAVLAETEAQWIFTEDELSRTPSVLDGMPIDKERDLRYKGVNFIMQVGILLKLSNITLGTACVFFNRFLMRHSLVDIPGGQKPLHHYQIAATSLFLATKVEEHCRKMKEIVVACCRVAQKSPNLLIDEQSKDYWRWRDTILFSEDVLLEAICFDVTVESPYKILYDMLNYYNLDRNKLLRNNAWAYLNDSGFTLLCLLFTSREIAASALYATAKAAGISFPDDQAGRPWWEGQRVRLREIRKACNFMAEAYENTPLKPGQESIYVGLRQSVDDDEQGENDATRMRFDDSQVPNTPLQGTARGFDDDTEERGVKRSRENTVESSTAERVPLVAAENGNVEVGDGHAQIGHQVGRDPLSRRTGVTSGSNLPARPPATEDGAEDRKHKRIKRESSGHDLSGAEPAVNGASAKNDNGSEEGELEE